MGERGRRPTIVGVSGRRVGILYATGAYFLCRHCSGLVYQSQREDLARRAARRAHRARARLGDHGALLDPLPKRPPRMHRKTYLAICAEIEAATELALGALAAQMIALQRRVEPLLERIHPKTEEPRAL